VTVGTSYCEIATGDTDVVVTADSEGHHFLLNSWTVKGVSQLFYEGATLRLSTSPTGVQLESATVDPDTSTISVSYLESGSGVRLATSFVVSDIPPVSEIAETLTVTSLSQSVSIRLYAVTDFDLAGTQPDDLAVSTADGTLFTETDGTTTGTVEVLSTPPDAFEVAVCISTSCPLGSIIQQNTTIPLDDSTTVSGPADLQHALSWDRTLDANQSFTAALRKTITVPEASGQLAAGGAGLVLLALARWRAARPGTITPARRGESCGGPSARRAGCG